jgi:pilus assembly protein TadC
MARLASLLLIAGLVALIVNHQLTATMAFGLIGAGAGLLLLGFAVHAAWHWRHYRIQKEIS